MSIPSFRHSALVRHPDRSIFEPVVRSSFRQYFVSGAWADVLPPDFAIGAAGAADAATIKPRPTVTRTFTIAVTPLLRRPDGSCAVCRREPPFDGKSLAIDTDRLPVCPARWSFVAR